MRGDVDEGYCLVRSVDVSRGLGDQEGNEKGAGVSIVQFSMLF